MLNHYADDGRVLTPPHELEPLLKGSFPAFSKLLGHIRLFYMVDEIWDGESSLTFSVDSEQLVTITLDEGTFDICIANRNTHIADDTMLDVLFEELKKVVPPVRKRPFEQLTMITDDLTKFPCGYRSDMCLLNAKQNENDFTSARSFGYLKWLCYPHCVPGFEVSRPDQNHDKAFLCSCATSPWKGECRYYVCPTEKGFASCIECGDYHTCDVHSDGHYAAQANLGMTSEEVTCLVIPYCMKERFDIFLNSNQQK
jgi:hypothetical protein